MSEDKKKPEEVKSEAKPLSIQEAVTAAIQEALPVAAALAAKALQDAQAKPAVITAPPMKGAQSRCSECGQFKIACKEKHRMAVVRPTDDEAQRWFTGVKINGVRYMSDHSSHYITVPEDCNIEYLVSAYERNEIIQRRGRKVSHNSGSIGATNNYQAFNGSGFGER